MEDIEKRALQDNDVFLGFMTPTKNDAGKTLPYAQRDLARLFALAGRLAPPMIAQADEMETVDYPADEVAVLVRDADDRRESWNMEF